MSKAPVFIVDDDSDVRDSLRALLESAGFMVRDFDHAKKLLAEQSFPPGSCLIADIRMPDMDGLQLQEELNRRQVWLPVIVVTGHGDVPLAVRAMKAGAVDFLEKPFDGDRMLEAVNRACSQSSRARVDAALADDAVARVALLTAREKEVLEHLVAGHANKVIAYELGISPRTVEVHRGHVVEKMQARSLSHLIQLALAAGIGPPANPGGSRGL
jgi:two-component system, LuxR family, response regulator FixJ